MLQTDCFYKALVENSISFFTGVPDSLLKDICAYITDHSDCRHHIIAANEGAALGIAAGHYLATGEVPLVYMQNSGLGNTVNPLLSLADELVYSIPRTGRQGRTAAQETRARYAGSARCHANSIHRTV